MSSVRLRRLNADFQNLSHYISRHARLRLIQHHGDPPERYQIEYRIKSLRKKDDDLNEVKKHVVEIALPRNYPRTPPQCRMLTPVFHPNIAPHAICVGDHWSAGESLESIAIRIGEMLAYQVYNVKSPLNGEAARWVEQHEDELPLDQVSMLVEESDEAEDDFDWNGFTGGATEAPQSAPPPAAAAAVPSGDPAEVRRQAPPPPATESSAKRIVVACGGCGKQYAVSAALAGRQVACKNCGDRFTITSS